MGGSLHASHSGALSCLVMPRHHFFQVRDASSCYAPIRADIPNMHACK